MTDWKKVKIHTTTPANDILCGRLLDYGIRGFEIDDPEDFKEFLENKEGKWDYIDEGLLKRAKGDSTVTVYVPDNSQGLDELAMINQMIADLKRSDSEGFYGSLLMEIDDINEEDWANNWKKYFKPFSVGKRLYIKPSWEPATGAENRKILEIDPESSFGTGQHETTKMCLEFLDGIVKGGENVLDMGSGSGILSIASILLGAKEVTACDVEENAVRIARENAKKNGISEEKYTLYCGNITDDKELAKKILSRGEYDIITANIVADVLKAMAPYFKKFIKSGGVLIASGIIEEREEEVCNAIVDSGFKLSEKKNSGGWSALKFIG